MAALVELHAKIALVDAVGDKAIAANGIIAGVLFTKVC